MALNKTLDYDDLSLPEIAPTAADLKSWMYRWLFTFTPLGINGAVRYRWKIRRHKLWEYSRGLALTGASRPARAAGARYTVLDVGGAMTMPVFYLASLGDRVVCLDINGPMTAQMRGIAARKSLPVDARTTNLVEEDPSGADLGAPGGFDRVYCFCVIEHIVPPGQARVAQRMARLLKPGGKMCLTFDYGEHAPTEAPMYRMDHVRAIQEAVGLPLLDNQILEDNGKRYPLNRKYPDKAYTFGSLFFHRPA